MLMTPEIAVIIPTYRDWDRLALCLAALGEQTLAQSRFEVIIANNDPADPVPTTLELAANVRIIPAEQPGSYAARNAALAEAKAPLLAFTDSDCIPAHDWLENAVGRFSAEPDCDLIAGGISLFFAADRPTAVERCDSLFFLQQQNYAAGGYAATANVIARRQVFDKIGPFNSALMSGGDKEWTLRATGAGHKMLYDPKAMIKHPARRSFRAMRKKSRRIAGGVVAKKRAAGRRLVLPQLDRVLPPRKAARKIYNAEGVGLWEGLKVYGLFYALRLTILGEQIRLALPFARYQR